MKKIPSSSQKKIHVGGTSENVHTRTVQRLLLGSAEPRPRASVKEQASVRERGTELARVGTVRGGSEPQRQSSWL